MSWIAEYDTQGREFPTCVHMTKTTDTMTHGATYVPIEDGRDMRVENAKLRELLHQVVEHVHKEHLPHEDISFWSDRDNGVFRRMRELGIEDYDD